MINSRDQDGDTNDGDNSSRIGNKPSMVSNDRLQSGKSMSIMNTQQNSKEKSELSSQRSAPGGVDNNRSSNISNTSTPASVASTMTSSNNSTNASNNSGNTLATNPSSLDNASSDTHVPSVSTGNATLSTQGREPK